MLDCPVRWGPWSDETSDETHLVPELGNLTSHHPELSTINLKKNYH